MSKLKYILFPFSLIYWLFTYCRNVCFDKGVLKQTEFDIPVISVGNITVGGTGKTPHVQYLVSLLQEKNIATLSRGYKRKSKGYVLANDNTVVSELGDEPYQLWKRFPSLHVAVCEKRVEGIRRLLTDVPDLDTIILDDAFQHRYVKPKMQIVLVDYNRPLWSDHVFPVGYMREGMYALSRADVVVVTKCPQELQKTEKEMWRTRLRLNNQKLFFSCMEYGNVYEFASKESKDCKTFFADHSSICLVTGIAQPQPLIDFVSQQTENLVCKTFADHYSYSEQDRKELDQLATDHTIVTTEKDVFKLAKILPNAHLYVIPIMPRFLFGEEEAFNSEICRLVTQR